MTLAIVDEFEAIAKRMRELKAAAPKGADEITELEKWRGLARQTARAYVESRRSGAAERPVLARRPQPTD
jgi:hypothetical protein